MNNVSDVSNLRTVCVTKKGTRYFYPKTIPRERESMTRIYFIIMGLVISVHLFFLTDDPSSFISVYAFTLEFYFFINLIYRVALLIHEKNHTQSRYENDFVKVIKAAFYFETKSILACILSTLYVVYHLARHGWPNFQKEFWVILAFTFFLGKVLDLESNPINDSLAIAKGNGLDYGSGMAYSFFYGYLNYILPKTGDEMKNLRELMQDYEAINNIKFEFYKIFMLIPKSLQCPVSIADLSNLEMEMRGSLPEKKITVAGVRERVYKNSVYSIKHEKTNKIVYVCAEYASPLKTFQEVVKNRTAHTEYYCRHRNDILVQFYLTLKQILEYEHMDNMCELVFYEDMDTNNKYYDVGRILLDRIVELKKQN